jgi:alpha-L-rhamnosidase
MWSPDMNSLNHYAYGAVCDWVFSKVGGLDTDCEKVGYKRIILRPVPGPSEISWAETKYESIYGLISLRWEIKGGSITVKVTVPPNTTAELTLPKAEQGSYGGIAFTGVEGASLPGSSAILGSGSYSFSYAYKG